MRGGRAKTRGTSPLSGGAPHILRRGADFSGLGMPAAVETNAAGSRAVEYGMQTDTIRVTER